MQRLRKLRRSLRKDLAAHFHYGHPLGEVRFVCHLIAGKKLRPTILFATVPKLFGKTGRWIILALMLMVTEVNAYEDLRMIKDNTERDIDRIATQPSMPEALSDLDSLISYLERFTGELQRRYDGADNFFDATDRLSLVNN